MQHELFMVFDVESVGLHGGAFAVGWVVVDREGRERSSGCCSIPPNHVHGSVQNRQWIAENVPTMKRTHQWLSHMRTEFWNAWLGWKARGAVLVADCPWPVEARFLADCVDDNVDEREWEGPYPLIDVASVMLAAGRDPLATHERRPSELPAHDPLADARQSARLLIEALNAMKGEA